MRFSQFARGVATVAATAALVAGCSRGEAVQQSESAEDFAEPVSITNCDRTQEFESPPQRIVSMNDHVTEVLVEMGVGDRIVGMGYQDAVPLPEFEEEFSQIQGLAHEYPTSEQILDLDPDLVVGGMKSAFNEKEGRSRDALEEKGISTFLFSEYCGTGFSDIGMLENDYAQLGQILGVEEAAGKVSGRVVEGLEQLRDKIGDAPPVPTFFYDSGDSAPMTIGGVGAGQLIADYSGATNLFSEGEKPYPDTTWETIGERAPEAIVVLDYGDKNAQQKIDFLKSQPIMMTTPAVQNDRFIVVPLDDFFESPRLLLSAQTIAEALHPDRVSQP
ncbi:ABC transporter substrate-binding protein [Rhodococcus sp. NPDC058521]|uniref:ABC transporter substrate-binding protein n=1 Tax=Rhodococcus sp. NPDC058521 TaxID=3346536 RepID=UPI00365D4B3E